MMVLVHQCAYFINVSEGVSVVDTNCPIEVKANPLCEEVLVADIDCAKEPDIETIATISMSK